MTDPDSTEPLLELARRLRTLGAPPTARELAEALWLARHVAPADTAAVAWEPVPPPQFQEPPTPSLPPETRPRLTTPTPPPTAGETGSTRLYADDAPLPPAPDGEAPVRVRAPVAPTLVHPMTLQRALRPLRHRRPPVRTPAEHLDEQATAEQAAETGLLIPVLRPTAHRIAHLQLLMDASSSTHVWDTAFQELRQICAGAGAFVDVRAHYVHEGPGGTLLVGPTRRSENLNSPEQLRDPTGRRLTLLLSDCAGPLWQDGRVQRLLHDWARVAPVALVQPLPQRMWHETYLPALPGTLHRGEGASAPVRFAPLEGGAPRGALPVLVVGPTPSGLAVWARLLSGRTAMSVPGAAGWVLPDHPAQPPATDEDAPEPAALVRDFRATTSGSAQQLVRALAAVPLQLDVMRLVQRVMLPQSGPSVLAEVLLGGVLRGSGEGWYEFRDGVREELLKSLPLGDAILVLKHCGAYVERHFGRGARNFPALAVDRLTGVGERGAAGEVPDALRPFAEVSDVVLGRYRRRRGEPAVARAEFEFAVVYAGFDQAWADWAGGVLEACGYRTRLVRWDASQGSLSDVMRTASASADQAVVLLSDWLLFQLDLPGARESARTLREFVADQDGRVVLVEVGEDELPATAGDFESLSLRPLDRDAATRGLLAHLGIRASPSHLPAGFPDDPLPVWSGVPLRNPRITGREELLDELRQMLLHNDVRPGVCALVGGSGMGKTQVVTEYAHRWRSEYDAVWWIDADVLPGKVLNRVARVLEEGQRVPEHRCLIVLDGWDIVEGAVEALSRFRFQHVVITSRNEDWAQHVPVLEVDPILGLALGDTRSLGEELLRKGLVRVETRGEGADVSGFFVAPGWVLTPTGTNWSAEPGAGVVTYDGRWLRIERVHRAGDLELLRVPDAVEEHCVWLSDQPFPSPGEVLVQAAGLGPEEEVPFARELVGLEGSSLRLGGALLTAYSEGGAVFDPRQGAVIGVMRLSLADGGGALSVPVATIGAAPLWHEVITAHDRHHWRCYADTRTTSWIGVQDELLRDAWQQRDFTPEWRAELYAIFAELPPPTGPEQVLRLATQRKVDTRLSPYAPHSWREGAGIAHHQGVGLGAVAVYAARVWAELSGPEQPRERLRSWVERAKEVLPEDQSRLRREIAAVVGASDLGPSVLVEVVNLAWEPHRFELRVMMRVGGELMPLWEYERASAENLPQILAAPLREAFRRADEPGSPAPLFWSLPTRLLNEPVEQWSPPPNEPFGTDRAVSVRSFDREEVLPEHLARWIGVRDGPLQGLSVTDSREEAVHERLSEAPATTVPYFCWHGAQPSPRVEVAVHLGYPVMLWTREPDHANCPEFHARVADLLERAATADQLLEHVRELRARAPREGSMSWARWITLFYDPPELVVPPPDLLEAP